MLNILKVSPVNKETKHYNNNDRKGFNNSLDFKEMLEMQLALKKTGKEKLLDNEKKN